ncbi:MAG TPA: hypothetical protein VFK79_06550 [Xanthobacteraceae bacterium]|nr:hypothetical protein [Xanthobacteraceae bacterium]
MSATRDEIKAIFGDLDEVKVSQILALGPTISELEEAAIWASGDGEVIGKGGRPPLSGKVADILEIIAIDEEDELPTAH